jgi:hypothetical protein
MDATRWSGRGLTEFHALHSDRQRRGKARYPLPLKLTFFAVTVVPFSTPKRDPAPLEN